MKTRNRKKLIHEGDFVAEVIIQVTDTDSGWSPYISISDAQKMEDVRNALRNGDIETASRFSDVYGVTPIAV